MSMSKTLAPMLIFPAVILSGIRQAATQPIVYHSTVNAMPLISEVADK
jgi:hypothetical protein